MVLVGMRDGVAGLWNCVAIAIKAGLHCQNPHQHAFMLADEIRTGTINGPILRVKIARIRPLMRGFSAIRHGLPERHRVSGFLKKMVSVVVGIVLTGADGSSYHYPTIVPKSRRYQADCGTTTDGSDQLQLDVSEMDSGRRSSHSKQSHGSNRN